MPRVLQLVHGFPPEQVGGTEIYASRLARAMKKRGWDIRTLAAHRLPGAPMYQRIPTEWGERIVNNAPYRGLTNGESDPEIDRWVEGHLRSFSPDLVQVQHLLFLSSTMKMKVPTVWTLHDAWGWCAAGGQLLREGQPCGGPSEHCGDCASGWAREPASVEGMIGLATKVGALVSPERLHRLWKRIPAALRAQIPQRKTELTQEKILLRNKNLLSFARRCARLISPSLFLSNLAIQEGFPAPLHIPHGVDAPEGPPSPRRHLLFLGTLSPHKGPLRIKEAWKAANSPYPLRIVGPPGPDLGYLAALSANEPRPKAAVSDPFPLLRSAVALVLGSIWPENAPLVVLEAQAVGCPVIAPAIGGLPEMVPPENLYCNEEELVALLKRAGELKIKEGHSFGRHADGVEGVWKMVLSA